MTQENGASENISIHSLRMEGDLPASHTSIHLSISIHSLRMEGDTQQVILHKKITYFNPLPPHGGRLSNQKQHAFRFHISIHSLRMEGD